MKLGFDARDRCRCQELAIGVQNEQIARPVEDDASARPEIAGQRPAPASLTRGKINDFHRPGKISQETELRG
jgi:hypothetical protein